MSRVFEASGPNGLIEAAEALLSSSEFDMAAVSGVLEPSSALLGELDDGSRQYDRVNSERLECELPQLLTVGALAETNWATKGYYDMEIVDGFMLDQWRKGGILPHVDELVYGDRKIEAGLQLSLCIKGLRRFRAERLPGIFRNEDETFDASAYNEFCKFGGQLQLELRAGRIPRSEALLRPGDVAMFPHHPVVTLHSATNVESSIARLISYNAEKK